MAPKALKPAACIGLFLLAYMIISVSITCSQVSVQHRTTTITHPQTRRSHFIPSAVDHDFELATTRPAVLGTVAIVVQNSVYNEIEESIQQYRKDLNGSGYKTILCTEAIETVQELKDKLTEWHDSDQILGAVLIGRLPYAEFYLPASSDSDAEIFICDLYLMDLDGTWLDIDSPSGVYDHHSASLETDIYPEIFVGRIDPLCLSWGESPAKKIQNYLSDIHKYRRGKLQRSNRAIAYVDDDWIHWGAQWASELGTAFSNYTYVGAPDLTTADGWIQTLKEDYMWAHLCAHSSPTAHYFRDGEYELVNSADIRQAYPSISFYNLYCCSGAEWTMQNNLAVTYLFSSNYSLGVIGSTKSGGMMDCENFYGPLSFNRTLGKSLVSWFSKSLNDDGEADEGFQHWYYGMSIVGDPLLSISYDSIAISPIISSPTHPNQTIWYRDQKPVFEWETPPDVNNISGYYYVIDQNPSTIPTKENGVFTNKNSIVADEDFEDGVWYVHVVSEDCVGNVASKANHYRVKIDSTAPEGSILHPVSGFNSSSDSIVLQWNANDVHSGYERSEVWLDTSSNLIYSGHKMELSLNGLEEGMHLVNITSFDRLGNHVSNQISFRVDLTDPTIEITSPEDGSYSGTRITLSWEATDEESGYQCTKVSIDNELRIIVRALKNSVEVTRLENGFHTLKVEALDWANRSSSIQITVNVIALLDHSHLLLAVGFLAVIVVLGFIFKRKLDAN